MTTTTTTTTTTIAAAAVAASTTGSWSRSSTTITTEAGTASAVFPALQKSRRAERSVSPSAPYSPFGPVIAPQSLTALAFFVPHGRPLEVPQTLWSPAPDTVKPLKFPKLFSWLPSPRERNSSCSRNRIPAAVLQLLFEFMEEDAAAAAAAAAAAIATNAASAAPRGILPLESSVLSIAFKRARVCFGLCCLRSPDFGFPPNWPQAYHKIRQGRKVEVQRMKKKELRRLLIC